MPFVKREILNFINEYNCHEEVLEIIDLINPAIDGEEEAEN